jgi:hypothetical protein
MVFRTNCLRCSLNRKRNKVSSSESTETMVRLSQLDMSNKVLLTFNNGFIYAFVPGEQIDINDQTIK